MAVGPRDRYAQTIKTGASTIGTTLAMSSIVAKYPIFANPFLHAIAEHFVEELIEGLVIKTEFSLFFNYIDLRTTKQGRDFFEALTKKQSLPKTATPEEIQSAEDDQVRKFALLAHLGS